jgi:exodeoxyribonuclease V beta subunit
VPFGAQEAADEVAETLGEVGDVDGEAATSGGGAGALGVGDDAWPGAPLAVAAGVAGAARDGLAALPGGSATGLFLHAVLEKVPLTDELGDLDRWGARADVRAVLARELARWEQDPHHLDDVLRAVHAALTAPLPVATGPLPGIARAERIRREVEFMFPVTELPGLHVSSPEDRVSAHPADIGGHADVGRDAGVVRGGERSPGGFVRGVLDVLFEHRGQVFFADWKSDRLPSYAGETLQRHVAENYDIQIQLYTLAVLRMLGISLSEPNASAEYERRFGGLAYVFLRGLPESGVVFARPTFSDVRAWSAALGGKRARP